jgi:hypothetical protein
LPTWQYDAAQVRVYVVAPPVTVLEIGDFSPGSLVTMSRDAPRWRKWVGVDGQVARTRGWRAGRVSFSLEDGSPFNALLSTLHAADDLLASGVAAIFIRDRNGLDLGLATRAWIVGPPDLHKADVAGAKDWLWDADEVEIFHGGLRSVDGDSGLRIGGQP